MALVRKCDRCGKEVIKHDVMGPKVTYYEVFSLFEVSVDLCQECFREFKKFIGEDPEGERLDDEAC